MRRQATGNEVLSILILSCSNYAKFKYSHADANGHCSWKNICTYLYTFSFIRQSTGPTHHCVDTLIARLVSRIRRSSLTFSSARSVKWETQSPDPSRVNVVPLDSKEKTKKSWRFKRSCISKNIQPLFALSLSLRLNGERRKCEDIFHCHWGSDS